MASKDDRKESEMVKLNGHQTKDEELPCKEGIVENDGDVEVEMAVPPDGGWGWVIVAASFMCNLIVDGIIFSFGVISKHIMESFGVSAARVALVGSLQTGFYLMAGPFVSALANRYGFRLVAILGSLTSCTAFLLSHLSTSTEFLYVSYGIIGGIGAGLIYVPAVITTGFYFERWRALATGISVCGSGIGAFLIAPITEYLVNNFGWRQTLVLQAGMLLNCAIFGALFRPLKPTRIKVKPTSNGDQDAKNPSIKGSTLSLHASQPSRRIFGANNNIEYPTAAQIIGSNHDLENNSRSLHSLHKIHEEQQREENNEKRLSAPIYPELEHVNEKGPKSPEEDHLLGTEVDKLENGRRNTITGRRNRADSAASQKSYTITQRSNAKDLPHHRPFYRDDIFYGGSLNRLSQFKSQCSSVGYHMSVTRLPTAMDVAEEESGNCLVCPESVRRILITMLDTSLLKSPSFLILAISGTLTMMGFYIPFMYLPDRATKAGIGQAASFLVSVIGIGNTIGRVGCGLASSLPGVDALTVNNVSISIAGICTILSGLSMTEEYQYFYAACFGLSISVFASLRSILVVDLVGLEKLTNAFGLLLLFQGVGAVVGAPLAGALMDLTQTYDLSFYVSGSLILLSAVICYPLKRINEWEKRNAGERA